VCCTAWVLVPLDGSWISTIACPFIKGKLDSLSRCSDEGGKSVLNMAYSDTCAPLLVLKNPKVVAKRAEQFSQLAVP